MKNCSLSTQIDLQGNLGDTFMMKRTIDNDSISKFIAKETNIGGKSAFNQENYQEEQINIRKNNSVEPGQFKTDPIIPGGYIAHEQTIRAMRKDLFMIGSDPDLLLMPYECTCGEELDLQFWEKCPYCSRSIELNHPKMS